MTNIGGRTCVWQWKVSEEGETQRVVSQSGQAANTGSGWPGGVVPPLDKLTEPMLREEGPDLEDSEILLRKLRARQRNGSPQVGELEEKGQGCGREWTSRQAPAERTPCDLGSVLE